MEEAAGKVAAEAVVECVNWIKRHYRYLSQYDQNIANLSTKVTNLVNRRASVQEKVNRADDNGQEIEKGVTDWLRKVNGIVEKAQAILDDEERVGNGCWERWCVNLIPRYSLSKKAVKEGGDLDTFLKKGEFDIVALSKRPLAHVFDDPMDTSEIKPATSEDNNKKKSSVVQHVPGVEGTASTSDAGADGPRESRFSMLNDVMAAVRDTQIRIVRICGMGGVGKSTMARQVEQMARDDRLFHEIAFVEVNQNPDLKNLQHDIAQLFGLIFEEDSVSARSKWLRERLNGKGQRGGGQNAQGPNGGGENKRILLILDNVWRREDLEEAGIPVGDMHSRCKILLTSRSNLVCKSIAAQKEFNVEVLPYEEALILFNKSLENSDSYGVIASALVEACGGLPLSIVAIARAVRTREEVDWTTALTKLQKSKFTGEYAKVFECLNVSYEFLQNDEIKKFFRLCCLFRKGSDVPIEDLARYGIALSLFNDPDTLYEARDEARSYVEMLLHLNLLLRSDQAGCFKVHDVVWDFSLSASSSDLFMVNHRTALTEWPREDSYEDYTLISLQCGEMVQVPERLNFQNLKLLQLTGEDDTCPLEFPESFYEGMVGLNVLVFNSMNIPSVPKSLEPLKKLRALSLHQCFIGDEVSMIGNLVNLEVLSFAHSNIKELPTKIWELKGLRLLDVTGCNELRVIAPHVLSQLSSLEELYMRGTRFWLDDGSQEMFVEIASMSKLGVIDIEIPVKKVLEMDTLFEKLKRFKISVNTNGRWEVESLWENCLGLKCDSSVLLQQGMKSLLRQAERICLTTITGLKTLVPLNDLETVAFSKAKRLSLEYCDELVYLVNMRANLHQNNVFPDLISLHLKELPFLEDIFRVWNSNESIALFNQKGPHTVCRFQNLRSLVVSSCDSLRNLFTPSTAISFGELQHLEVMFCKSLQAIVAAEGRKEEEEEEGSAMEVILLPKLNHLHLKSLPSLSTILPKGYTLSWSSLKILQVESCGGESDIFANKNNIQRGTTTGHKIALTSLEMIGIRETNPLELWRNHFPGGLPYELRDMHIYDFGELSVLFSPNLIRGFDHLEYVHLRNCESLKVVFDHEEELIVGGVTKVATLNKLDHIQIHKLPNMTHVWKNVPKNFEGFRSLTSVEVHDCGSLTYLFSPSIAKCLVKLQSVKIEDCGGMEEVISKRDEEGGQGRQNVVEIFPHLQELLLYSLPSLKCFGPGVFAFDKLYLEAPNVGSTQTHHDVNASSTSTSALNFNEKIALASLEDTEIMGTNSMELWPDHFAGGFSYGLRNMTISRCHNVVVLFPCNLIQRFCSLEGIELVDCESLKVVFDLEELTAGGNHKLVILDGRLDHIHLRKLPKMTHVWNKVPESLQGFQFLSSLKVEYCDSLRYLFSPLIAKCLLNLRYLRITSCKGMDEVVSKSWDEEGRGNAVDMIFFPELEKMELEDLPSLLCLGPAGASANCRKPSFRALNVRTDKTHDQGNPNTSTSTPIFNEKITLTSLEDVETRGTNWFSYGSRIMWLENCHELKVLFSSNLIKGFHRLEYLNVERCDSLKVIFNLEEDVGVGEHKVVKRNQLAGMFITSLPKLTHVWKKGPKYFEEFSNLTTLQVEWCKSLRYLFSPLIAKCLVKLQKLWIESCKEMEEVVSEKEEEGDEGLENSVDIIFFPELVELALKNLPSLICFGPGGASANFDKPSFGALNVGTDETHDQDNASTSISTPIFNEKSSNPTSSAFVTLEGIGRYWSLHKLTRVEVYRCDKMSSLFPSNIGVRLPVLQSLSVKECTSLEYVFSTSTVRSLKHLNDLEIIDCKMMEVIVKDENEVVEELDGRSKLEFPSLSSLTLTRLPNLRGVYLGMLDFEWPSLKSVVIESCPYMRIFTSESSTTPILGGVIINSYWNILEEGGVNTTLTSGQQKDVDNFALKEEGILTINGFIRAGEHLVAECPSWSWPSVPQWQARYILPAERQYLITRKVPCLRRARAASSRVVAEEDKNEAVHGGGDDDDDTNIPRPRTYDVSITYDVYSQAPSLWLKGYDELDKDLSLELVLEDIAEFHPREFVTIEKHPYLGRNYVSLYPSEQPSFIKFFFDRFTRQGFQPSVENYLQLFMDSLIPTIQCCIR